MSMLFFLNLQQHNWSNRIYPESATPKQYKSKEILRSLWTEATVTVILCMNFLNFLQNCAIELSPLNELFNSKCTKDSTCQLPVAEDTCQQINDMQYLLWCCFSVFMMLKMECSFSQYSRIICKLSHWH